MRLVDSYFRAGLFSFSLRATPSLLIKRANRYWDQVSRRSSPCIEFLVLPSKARSTSGIFFVVARLLFSGKGMQEGCGRWCVLRQELDCFSLNQHQLILTTPLIAAHLMTAAVKVLGVPSPRSRLTPAVV